ncbi:MAG: leucyl aminopeptidase, partial [Deferribacterales bacterium]|nr:leucyl aminopeptidase [Deferribacterales bacterium]
SDSSWETDVELWVLPLFEDFADGFNCDVADIQNMSSFKREGAAIHAALFLRQFVDNYPWVHIDIAGTAYFEREHPVFGKGASGFGVRLLYNFIKAQYCA